MVNIQAICVICYHFLCWTVLSNLDMISQIVIAVLFAVVAEERDSREQDTFESEGILK